MNKVELSKQISSKMSGRNPKTGVPVTIKARKSVKFKPGKQLLEALNK